MTTDLEVSQRHTRGSRGLREFATDLSFGARLALRGGRPGWTRLLLTAGGLGLCVVVLLVGTSITGAMTARQARSDALTPFYDSNSTSAPPGSSLFEAHQTRFPYAGQLVTGNYLAALRGTPALPPGLSAFPPVGALVVSPALESLLSLPAGAGLRPQIQGVVIGLIGDDGLTSPTDLRFYRGISPTNAAKIGSSDTRNITDWAWGNRPQLNLGPYYNSGSNNRYFQLLVTAGAALVLVPLTIFVLIMSRLGAATRELRFAAIRLMGASARQLTTLIAGETLVAAALGSVLGGLGFLLARLAARWLTIGGEGFFPSDLRPGTSTALVVLLGVPFAAVAAGVLGSRSAVQDPLAASRPSSPPRPRLWWRLVIVAAGVGLTAVPFGLADLFDSDFGLVFFAGAVVLVLLGVPLLLPLILSVVLGRLGHSGSVARQLALRHLQLNAGSSARVVSGASIVLAGAIALQSLLVIGTPLPTGDTMSANHRGSYRVHVDSPTIADVTGITARINGSGQFFDIRGGAFLDLSTPSGDVGFEVYVGDCAQILTNTGIADCHDGDAFAVSGEAVAAPGTRWVPNGVKSDAAFMTIPDGIKRATMDPPKIGATDFAPDVVMTIGALGPQAAQLLQSGFVSLLVRPVVADVESLQQLRSALADLTWRVQVSSFDEVLPTSGRAQLTATIQLGLLVAGLLTLLVAAAGLVLVATEQLARRRRALTLLVASGVPRSVVGRSIMIAIALPAVIGAALAILVGLGLSAYLQLSMVGAVSIDPLAILVFAGTELAAVLSVTAATLPAVRRLTRLESLRTE